MVQFQLVQAMQRNMRDYKQFWTSFWQFLDSKLASLPGYPDIIFAFCCFRSGCSATNLNDLHSQDSKVER